jgi:eukaryotic-like serine/threonine-protein kinase
MDWRAKTVELRRTRALPRYNFALMALVSGTKLGPYEIVAPLGAGGMGEVYRARDARLGREVAIKILPQHLSSNPQLRERFDREARAISSLNHPRICTLYDVGHQDGVDFLVMEYLEGESLADRLRRGPVPLKETVRIGMEVCEALDTAHRARIIHRDLKPGNIMLTKGGAKLMDFGLAKAALAGMAADGAAVPLLSAARTISGISPISPLTTAGEVLGTIQYMSPEQLEGKEADARSDIFALGAVLYEMVTGKRPFDGKSQISVASAILEKDPEPISAIQPLTPPALERMVKTCLEKNPDDRFQSARDVRLELKWIGDGAAQATAAASTTPLSSGIARILPWAICGALALALVGVFFFTRSKPADVSYSMVTFREGEVGAARFSHDGNSVVYSGLWEGGPLEIDTFRVGSFESRDLGVGSATIASASSTDELAVLRNCVRIFLLDCGGTLATVDLAGGSPRDVAKNIAYADWSPDGTQLMVSRISGAGTQLEYPLGHVVYQQKAGWFGRPRLSPDGSLIAFENHANIEDDEGEIDVVDLHGNKTTLATGFISLEGLAWGPGGKEVWFAANSPHTGWADSIRAVTLSGKMRTLLTSPSIRLHDVSKDGRVLLSRDSWRTQMMGFFPGDNDMHPYSWLDNSEPTGITSDGRTMSFVEEGEVWAIASEGQCYVRATNGSPAVSYGAGQTAISPDGKSIILFKQQGAKLELQPAGAGESRDLSTSAIAQYDHVSWSDDGRFIAFEGETAQQDWNVYVQAVAGGTPRLVQGSARNSFPRLAPDGRTMALRLEQKGILLNRMDGSPLVPLSVGHESEYPVRFTSDGKSLLVAEPTGHEIVVDIVNLADGRRTPWKQFKSEGTDASRFVITPDLKYYAFAVPRYSSVLNIVSGLH